MAAWRAVQTMEKAVRSCAREGGGNGQGGPRVTILGTQETVLGARSRAARGYFGETLAGVSGEKVLARTGVSVFLSPKRVEHTKHTRHIIWFPYNLRQERMAGNAPLPCLFTWHALGYPPFTCLDGASATDLN